jgi:hypothetical protein
VNSSRAAADDPTPIDRVAAQNRECPLSGVERTWRGSIQILHMAKNIK